MQAKSKSSVEIDEVFENGPAHHAGVMPGDRIIEINGNRIRDVIDLMYYGNDESVELKIKRGSDKKVLTSR
jgi:C-terminal processing protease CtpA/Prc